MLPGLRASMWRVLADPAPGGHGVGISEITFYRCSGRKLGKARRDGKLTLQFNGILWDFNGILMGFYGILMGFYGILWDLMGFDGI